MSAATAPVVRDAGPADLAAVAAIYDHQVATGHATFDTEPRPLSAWTERLASRAPGDHFLVAVDGAAGPGGGIGIGGVLGYAHSSTYRPRPAYDRTRETTVYLAEDAQGRGLGRLLYDALLARLRADGMHLALAVVATPNPASEALHAAFGYERVGLLPEVGNKFGRWIDTGIWALRLDVGAGSGEAAVGPR